MRYRLTLAALILVSPLHVGAEPTAKLDIYVVRGGSDALKQFKAEMARGWTGGKFLDHLSSGTEHRYWAYPTRTAPEAREFIFGSLSHGVQLDFEEYQERTYYPKERALLDAIASQCRVKSDSFFIEPDLTLVLANVAADSTSADCVRSELSMTQIREMTIRFAAEKKPGERG